jgi:hypothetical protein
MGNTCTATMAREAVVTLGNHGTVAAVMWETTIAVLVTGRCGSGDTGSGD